jgi:hypothetical protein
VAGRTLPWIACGRRRTSVARTAGWRQLIGVEPATVTGKLRNRARPASSERLLVPDKSQVCRTQVATCVRHPHGLSGRSEGGRGASRAGRGLAPPGLARAARGLHALPGVNAAMARTGTSTNRTRPLPSMSRKGPCLAVFLPVRRGLPRLSGCRGDAQPAGTDSRTSLRSAPRIRTAAFRPVPDSPSSPGNAADCAAAKRLADCRPARSGLPATRLELPPRCHPFITSCR